MQSRVIMWTDPGKTTGCARWVSPAVHELRKALGLEPIPTFEVAQVGGCETYEGLKELSTLLTQWTFLGIPYAQQGLVTLGVESFDFRHEERYRDKIDYTPAEVIGALRQWQIARPHVALARSSAATAKAFWTDDKIKKLALWVPGQRHAMDALRHLLYKLTFGTSSGDELQTELLEQLKN